MNFSETVNVLCEHCRSGNLARQRHDTKEWVHDIRKETGIKGQVVLTHTMCGAHRFRIEHDGL